MVTGVIALLAVLFYFRFRYTSPFAATWDEVDFALALHRYDLLAMQPHFPGYPFFILGGMLVHVFIHNPTQALAVFNGIVVASASIPMYLLARQHVSRISASIVVLVMQTNGYLSILTMQPMSEGAALGVLWWYIWSLFLALHRKETTMKILPLVLFAVLMGIRLSYAPFGIALLILWRQDWKRYKKASRLIAFIVLALLLQCVWLGALIFSEGGLVGFLKLSYGFLQGHFTEWGGAITQTKEPLYGRLYRLVVHNIGWTGMFVQSVWLAVIGLTSFLLYWRRFSLRQYLIEHWLVVLLLLVYFVWNLLAQNIDKPRHSFPIVMLLLFSLIVFLSKNRKGTRILFVGLAMAQLFTSISLMKEQAIENPAIYQLAQYLKKQEGEFIVYTWEETRVMEYLHVPYEHKRFYKYDYFLQDKKYHTNDTIYVTNHLVDGFRRQGIEVSGHLEEEARFHSNEIFDPVYNDIILYKWID
ncbi:hypothetical protein J7Q84_12730 [Bacillus sp. 165]|nr:hypothetical protein [Bacillus sp. 165]